MDTAAELDMQIEILGRAEQHFEDYPTEESANYLSHCEDTVLDLYEKLHNEQQGGN